MAKYTSIKLGKRYDSFISKLIKDGSYSSVSEVIIAGLRILECKETKLKNMQNKLIEGEESGFSNYSYGDLMRSLDQGKQ